MRTYYQVMVTHHYKDDATGQVQDYSVEYGVAEVDRAEADRTADRAKADFPDSTVTIRPLRLEVNA